MDAPDHLTVDLINGDPLDNRRKNLRFATMLQQGMNRHHIRGASRFKGVLKDRRRDRWFARITYEGRQNFLGYHKTEEEAARCLDNDAASRIFGEFSHLNELSA